MKHHIFTTILTYEVVKQGLTIVNPNADIVNRTRTTFLLDSLASYWNAIIPYRQAVVFYLVITTQGFFSQPQAAPIPLWEHCKINMIKVSLYPSQIQSYSATVEISLSFQVRPLASYPCQARIGLIPTNFTVRSDLLFANQTFAIPLL